MKYITHNGNNCFYYEFYDCLYKKSYLGKYFIYQWLTEIVAYLKNTQVVRRGLKIKLRRMWGAKSTNRIRHIIILANFDQ